MSQFFRYTFGPFLLICVAIGLSGCGGQGNERLQEKAKLESEQEQEAINENLRQKAVAMETDLEIRRRFLNSVSGVFEGTFEGLSGSVFSIRATFTPSLPAFPSSQRPRTIEELSFELSNLHLNAHITTWKDGFAAGCVFQNVRPDISEGKIHLVSENCVKTYTLHLASDLSERSSEAQTFESKELAKQITIGSLTHSPALMGLGQSNFSAELFPVRLGRKVE